MLIFWCMAAIAALLLFLKIQTVLENRKARKAQKDEDPAATPGERKACQCEDAAYEQMAAEARSAQSAAEDTVCKP